MALQLLLPRLVVVLSTGRRSFGLHHDEIPFMSVVLGPIFVLGKLVCDLGQEVHAKILYVGIL
jgi:hypothetical protein